MINIIIKYIMFYNLSFRIINSFLFKRLHLLIPFHYLPSLPHQAIDNIHRLVQLSLFLLI